MRSSRLPDGVNGADGADDAPCSPSLSAVLGCALLLVALFVFPAFSRDLWNPDEPRIAHIAQGMLASGDWVVPHVNGRPFVEKPPLQAWAIAACLAVFGAGFDLDWVPRLPSMLAAALTLVVTARIGTRHWGPRVGLLAAMLLALTAEFFIAFQRATMDTTLTLAVTLGCGSLIAMAAERRVAWRDALVLGAATGVAFLAKNLVGVAFVGLLAVALAVRQPRVYLTRVAFVRLLVAAVVALVVVAPWLAAFAARRPELLREMLLDNSLGRFGSEGFHDPPRLEFLHRGLSVLLPALLLALPTFAASALALSSRRRAAAPPSSARGGHAVEGLLWWVLLPFALVLASGSRREVYLLPLTPAVALAAAHWLEPRLASRWMRRAGLALAALGTLAVLACALVGGVWAGRLPWPVWGWAAALGAILWREARTPRRFSGERASWLGLVAVLMALGAGSLVFYSARNRVESYVPLCRDLLEHRRDGYEVIGAALPLRDECALAYYLGGRLENVTSHEDAAVRFAATDRPAVFVFRATEEDFVSRLARYWDVGEYEVRRRIRVVANRASDAPVSR